MNININWFLSSLLFQAPRWSGPLRPHYLSKSLEQANFIPVFYHASNWEANQSLVA